MPLTLSIIGKRLAKVRKEKGFSQDELAEVLNVSSAYVGRVERGTTCISLPHLASVCDLFNVPIEWFILGAYTPNNADYNRQFGTIAAQCNPETIEVMLNVCEQIAALNQPQTTKSEPEE